MFLLLFGVFLTGSAMSVEKQCQLDNIADCMTNEERLRVFGTSQDVPDYKVVKLEFVDRTKRSTDETLRARLLLEDKPLELLLKPETKITSPKFITVARSANTTHIYTDTKRDCLYTGTIVGHPGSKIAVSRCYNSESFLGYIMDPAGDYAITPLPYRIKDASVIYKLNNVQYDIKESLFDKIKASGEDSITKRRKREVMEMYGYTVELAVFMDFSLFAFYDNLLSGSPEEKIRTMQDIAMSMVLGMQALFESGTLNDWIVFSVVRIEIFQDSTERFTSENKNTIATYLTDFCTWQETQKPSKASNVDSWNHAILLTKTTNKYESKRNDYTVCSPVGSCSVFNGDNLGIVYVMAHIMGHFLGMIHDGQSETSSGNNCENLKYIMTSSPQTETKESGHRDWSECSAEELSKFLNSSNKELTACLKNSPRNVYFGSPGYFLPGEMFTALDQCQIGFGKQWIPANTSNPEYKDICKALFCENKDTTTVKFLHPALKGTECLPDGFCDDGACLEKENAASHILPLRWFVGMLLLPFYLV